VYFDFQTRRCGVLLHPTSLPGPHGSGDLGPNAYRFVDWLQSAGQTLWQVLPLNPIGGAGHSPYSGVSAFAGNPLLIALEPLTEHGWLAADLNVDTSQFNDLCVNFGHVVAWRMQQLHSAWQGFCRCASDTDQLAFRGYCESEKAWLEDYALFMALDQIHNPPDQAFRPWCEWDSALAQRDPQTLQAARLELAGPVFFWQFVQWCFDTQWQALRRYAREHQVFIVGDMPIFIAHHSADCWARPDLFLLDAQGQPSVVAGVPPDFYSPTGQRWGSPLYRWDVFQQEGFAWWIARIQRQLALSDVIRIDHFRGFAACWEIPATCPTAEHGNWMPAPGRALFTAIQEALGKLPIIAEDLGIITPDVVELREAFSFPGMRILQFAFSETADNAFLPHNYTPCTVAYTGTHDNDTVLGWWSSATEREQAFARIYLGGEEPQSHWAMIRAVLASVAQTVIVPMQDVLGLDGRHRMNTPGQLGAWHWRFAWDWLDHATTETLGSLSATYGRAPIDRLQLPAYPVGQPHP